MLYHSLCFGLTLLWNLAFWWVQIAIKVTLRSLTRHKILKVRITFSLVKFLKVFVFGWRCVSCLLVSTVTIFWIHAFLTLSVWYQVCLVLINWINLSLHLLQFYHGSELIMDMIFALRSLVSGFAKSYYVWYRKLMIKLDVDVQRAILFYFYVFNCLRCINLVVRKIRDVFSLICFEK